MANASSGIPKSPRTFRYDVGSGRNRSTSNPFGTSIHFLGWYPFDSWNRRPADELTRTLSGYPLSFASNRMAKARSDLSFVHRKFHTIAGTLASFPAISPIRSE